MLWWSSGWYGGTLRQRVLQLRQRPEAWPMQSLLAPLLGALVAQPLPIRPQSLLLVPIPSGGEHPNPLPQLLAEALLRCSGWAPAPCAIRPELLLRSHRVRPQHQLRRADRWRNQWLSFRALLEASPRAAAPPGPATVLLVDDVLTSGATAVAAQQALQSAGWQVAGLLCLARTPRPCRRRPLATPEGMRQSVI